MRVNADLKAGGNRPTWNDKGLALLEEVAIKKGDENLTYIPSYVSANHQQWLDDNINNRVFDSGGWIEINISNNPSTLEIKNVILSNGAGIKLILGSGFSGTVSPWNVLGVIEINTNNIFPYNARLIAYGCPMVRVIGDVPIEVLATYGSYVNVSSVYSIGVDENSTVRLSGDDLSSISTVSIQGTLIIDGDSPEILPTHGVTGVIIDNRPGHPQDTFARGMYMYIEETPTDVHYIYHDLGRLAGGVYYDLTTSKRVFPDEEYVDDNTITASFATPVAIKGRIV